jgi:hypothetical protein
MLRRKPRCHRRLERRWRAHSSRRRTGCATRRDSANNWCNAASDLLKC